MSMRIVLFFFVGNHRNKIADECGDCNRILGGNCIGSRFWRSLFLFCTGKRNSGISCYSVCKNTDFSSKTMVHWSYHKKRSAGSGCIYKMPMMYCERVSREQ